MDIYNTMMHGDRFMLCADFADYLRAQAEVDNAYMVSLIWPNLTGDPVCFFFYQT